MRLSFEGVVTHTKGTLIGAEIPSIPLGAEVMVHINKDISVSTQVVGFNDSVSLLAPLNEIDGVYSGAKVTSQGNPLNIKISDEILGCVVDALGVPLNNTKINGIRTNLHASPPPSLSRPPICEQLQTGIKVIDTLLPLGKGQRTCLIAPAGTGKSTLLSHIAKSTEAQVIVIALIGERGREVREFLDLTLTEELKKKCVVVVSTSEEAAIRRAKAQETATTIAEYFRDKGKDVLLLVDSLTRTARALRDVGLSLGEMPVRHGFTPSVFAKLPVLLERTGTSEKGSITAIYTLLGSDEGGTEDPLAEEIKSLLDGHIILSREIAASGIRPAINILKSLSRVGERLTPEHLIPFVSKLRKLLQRIERDKEIILLGGNPDPELKEALMLEKKISSFRNQGLNDCLSISEARTNLKNIFEA